MAQPCWPMVPVVVAAAAAVVVVVVALVEAVLG